MILRFFILFLSMLMSLTPQAEIILDGSLGPQGTLQGPDYQIEAGLGYQQGHNLFHSFSQFNLTAHERAVFSGPLTVKNIITRVTGGQPAFINGDLVSTLADADFFLLNPAGAVFGPQAQLDVKGSFHLSTADYLRLGQDGYFYAQPLKGDVLSTASPTAFGFLKSPQEALIHFQGGGNQIRANMRQKSGLAVATGKTFSVIGDQIQLNQGHYYLKKSGQTVHLNNLLAPSGHIQLMSVGRAYGEVALTPGFELNLHGELGTIGMNDNVLIDVSGAQPGRIALLGKQLILNNSRLFAHALDTPEHASTVKAQPSIEVTADELSLKNSSGFLSHSFTHAHAGDIRVQAQQLSLEQDSRIESYAFSSGHAGDIAIEAARLSLNRSSWIASRLYQRGNAGDISLKAHTITLNDGSWISSNADLPYSKSFNKALEITLKSAEQLNIAQEYPSGNTSNISIETQDMLLRNGGIASVTHGSGQAGSIDIQAQGHITVVGADPSSGWQSQILAVSDPSVAGIHGGAAGDITLKARSITLAEGGQVSSSTVAAQNRYSASAGNIHIQVTEVLTLTGVNPYGENENGFGSGIYARSIGQQAGDAGDIAIAAGAIDITHGAMISSSTSGQGQGGSIQVQVKNQLDIKGDSAAIELQAAQGSQLEFQRSFPDQQTEVATSGIYASSSSKTAEAGIAGTIQIAASKIQLMEGGLINTATKNASGGHIEILTPRLLYLHQGQITTSVQGGQGQGGDITVANPAIVVLNAAQITAQADQGHGGDIKVLSQQLVQSSRSLINASSRVGIDGHIMIHSPEETVSNSLTILPATFVDASSFFKQSCQKPSETSSRFVAMAFLGNPPAPSDWQSSQTLRHLKQQPKTMSAKHPMPQFKKPLVVFAQCSANHIE